MLSKLKRRRRRAAEHGGHDGFAAVDAMVALFIIATVIILSIRAVDIAGRASARAVETRQASALLVDLLERPAVVGNLHGQVGDLVWRSHTMSVGSGVSETGLGLCDHLAEATSVRGGRRYRMEIRKTCPAMRP